MRRKVHCGIFLGICLIFGCKAQKGFLPQQVSHTDAPPQAQEEVKFVAPPEVLKFTAAEEFSEEVDADVQKGEGAAGVATGLSEDRSSNELDDVLVSEETSAPVNSSLQKQNEDAAASSSNTAVTIANTQSQRDGIVTIVSDEIARDRYGYESSEGHTHMHYVTISSAPSIVIHNTTINSATLTWSESTHLTPDTNQVAEQDRVLLKTYSAGSGWAGNVQSMIPSAHTNKFSSPGFLGGGGALHDFARKGGWPIVAFTQYVEGITNPHKLWLMGFGDAANWFVPQLLHEAATPALINDRYLPIAISHVKVLNWFWSGTPFTQYFYVFWLKEHLDGQEDEFYTRIYNQSTNQVIPPLSQAPLRINPTDYPSVYEYAVSISDTTAPNAASPTNQVDMVWWNTSNQKYCTRFLNYPTATGSYSLSALQCYGYNATPQTQVFRIAKSKIDNSWGSWLLPDNQTIDFKNATTVEITSAAGGNVTFNATHLNTTLDGALGRAANIPLEVPGEGGCPCAVQLDENENAIVTWYKLTTTPGPNGTTIVSRELRIGRYSRAAYVFTHEATIAQTNVSTFDNTFHKLYLAPNGMALVPYFEQASSNNARAKVLKAAWVTFN